MIVVVWFLCFNIKKKRSEVLITMENLKALVHLTRLFLENKRNKEQQEKTCAHSQTLHLELTKRSSCCEATLQSTCDIYQSLMKKTAIYTLHPPVSPPPPRSCAYTGRLASVSSFMIHNHWLFNQLTSIVQSFSHSKFIIKRFKVPFNFNQRKVN